MGNSIDSGGGHNLSQTGAEALEKIGAHPFFAALSPAVAGEFIASCEPFTAIAGQAIWSPSETKDAAYILVSGHIEVSSRVQPDGQREDHHVTPGGFLTLSSLVHSWKHESAGIALERSELLRLPRENFETLFEAAHPAALSLVDAIADDLVAEVRDANRRLHEVFGHPAETLRMLRRRSRGAT